MSVESSFPQLQRYSLKWPGPAEQWPQRREKLPKCGAELSCFGLYQEVMEKPSVLVVRKMKCFGPAMSWLKQMWRVERLPRW